MTTVKEAVSKSIIELNFNNFHCIYNNAHYIKVSIEYSREKFKRTYGPYNKIIESCLRLGESQGEVQNCFNWCHPRSFPNIHPSMRIVWY